jgi:uncharacterized protein
MHPNEQLVRKAYTAFTDCDTDTLRQVLSEAIVFRIPGNSPMAGEYRGRDTVFGYLGKLMDRSGGTWHLDVHDVIANEDHVVGLIIQSGTREDHQTTFRSVHVWHSDGSQLTELWEYPEQPAFDDFWT